MKILYLMFLLLAGICSSAQTRIASIQYSRYDGGKGQRFLELEIRRDSTSFVSGSPFQNKSELRIATPKKTWDALSKTNVAKFDKIQSGLSSMPYDGEDEVVKIVETNAKQHEVTNGDYRSSKAIIRFVEALRDLVATMQLKQQKRGS